MIDVPSILRRRGVLGISISDSRKRIEFFEKNFQGSNELFRNMRDKPFLRFLLSAISEKGEYITLLELMEYLSKVTIKKVSIDSKALIYRTLPHSPFGNVICRNKECGAKIDTVDRYKPEVTKDVIKCPYCRTPNYWDEIEFQDVWNIGENEIEEFIRILETIEAIKKHFQTTCPRCRKNRRINVMPKKNIKKLNKKQLAQYIENFYCERCNELAFTQEVIFYNEIIFTLWGEKGYWLEWFVKNLLKDFNFDFFEHGVKVRRKNEECEVDILAIYKGKVVSVECKDKSIVKRIDKGELDEVTKLTDFSDIVMFVTTTAIEKRAKKDLKKVFDRMGKRLLLVEGKNIQFLTSLPHYLDVPQLNID